MGGVYSSIFGMGRLDHPELDGGSNGQNNGGNHYSSSASQKDVAKQKTKKEFNSEAHKDIFTYPKDFEHLKYFGKMPSHEQITTDILQLYEAYPKHNLNKSLDQLRREFDKVRRSLYPYMTWQDRKVMQMPGLMQSYIDDGAEGDKKTFLEHLRDSFYTYSITPNYESVPPPVQWIDYQFATKHPYVQESIKDLTNNIFNDIGQKTLLEKLEKSGAFQGGDKEFYMWNTDPRNWSETSHQSRSVNWGPYFCQPWKWSGIMPPQYGALGDFTIHALPEGTIKLKENGKYEVHIKKVYYAVVDSFNFEGFEPLGYWDFVTQNTRERSYDLPSDYQPITYDMAPLSNAAFRHIQRLGIGRYFPVRSKLHELENFQGQLLEYPLAK